MKSTTRFTKNKRGVECLNCGQPISNIDNFCSNCGQVNDILPLSIKQFISEFFAGFFSFDSRFFKTFIPLLFKPGKVSKEYIEGKRRKYVNPFQLYLHVTILFFLISGIFSSIDEYNISDYSTIDNTEKSDENSAINEITNALNEINLDTVSQGSLKKNKTDIIEININNIDTDSFLNNKDKTISQLSHKTKLYIDSIFQKNSIAKELKNESISKEKKDSIFDKFYLNVITHSAKLIDSSESKAFKELTILSKIKQFNTLYIEQLLLSKNISYIVPEKYKISLEDTVIKGQISNVVFKKISEFMAYDKEHENTTIIEALNSLNYDKTRWNIFYYKKAQDFNKFKNNADFRKSYLDSIISKISVALFFMLPIFTLFLSLLYFRHKKNYTEHLVFVFNVQTVFFILLIIFTILDRILTTDAVIEIFLLIFLIYLYKSLRNFYKQKRTKTIIKYFILNTVFIFLAVIGFLIISFISFIL